MVIIQHELQHILNRANLKVHHISSPSTPSPSSRFFKLIYNSTITSQLIVFIILYTFVGFYTVLIFIIPSFHQQLKIRSFSFNESINKEQCCHDEMKINKEEVENILNPLLGFLYVIHAENSSF